VEAVHRIAADLQQLAEAVLGQVDEQRAGSAELTGPAAWGRRRSD
jgi:hypothetical protein